MQDWRAAVLETQVKLVELAKAIEDEQGKLDLLERLAEALQLCDRALDWEKIG